MDKKDQFITVDENLKIWTETFGSQTDEACLFIAGAGANCSFWSGRLCGTLADQGCFVIKYDHRDFGFSSKIDFDKNPYDFSALVKDAVQVLDALNVEKLHIIGHSMGGFIAQLLAIKYPERVRSMTSISSSTNSPDIPPPPDKTWKIFKENKPQGDFETDLAGFLTVWKYLNGTADFDKELAIEYTKNLYARQKVDGPLGHSHVQAQAGLADRSGSLKKVKIPSLIIHGKEDYLVDIYGGIQTAVCIENSKLVLIPEMGHISFNRQILERFEQEIIQFIGQVK